VVSPSIQHILGGLVQSTHLLLVPVAELLVLHAAAVVLAAEAAVLVLVLVLVAVVWPWIALPSFARDVDVDDDDEAVDNSQKGRSGSSGRSFKMLADPS
jgi:hypothetical protein